MMLRNNPSRRRRSASRLRPSASGTERLLDVLRSLPNSALTLRKNTLRRPSRKRASFSRKSLILTVLEERVLTL